MTGREAYDIRKRLNLNQLNFWQAVGVTQSGGSRYESGREIPKPVVKLLTIAYGSKLEAIKTVAQIRGLLKKSVVIAQ